MGWNITLRVMESGAGFDAYWAGDYQFAVQGGSIFMNDPGAIFVRYIRGTTPQWSGGGRGKYYAPEGLEALFEQQVREPDQEKRKAIVQEMGRLAYEGSANPYIYWVDRHHGVEHRIQNYQLHLPGDALGARMVRPGVLVEIQSLERARRPALSRTISLCLSGPSPVEVDTPDGPPR